MCDLCDCDLGRGTISLNIKSEKTNPFERIVQLAFEDLQKLDKEGSLTQICTQEQNTAGFVVKGLLLLLATKTGSDPNMIRKLFPKDMFPNTWELNVIKLIQKTGIHMRQCPVDKCQ
ncbi:hypothetical protein KKA15_06230 [Patescibacteria group bacterium]|nr:hypothetical protein [Patescibacteria group bacterium]